MCTLSELKKLKTIQEKIDKQVQRAISLKELFEFSALNKDFKEKLSKSLNNSEECYGFNACVESILFDFIMTLMRIYDDPDINRINVCFKELFKILDSPSVVSHLKKQASKNVLSRETVFIHGTKDLRKLNKSRKQEDARNAEEKVQESIVSARSKFSEINERHYKARLRKDARHQLISHLALERKTNQYAKIGDAEELLKLTIPLMNDLNFSILGSHNNYETISENWKKRSKAFWSKLIN